MKSLRLCEQQKPIAKALFGSYQSGFRPAKSTIDQLFTLRQVVEKSQEIQFNINHVFVDQKAPFDSPIRNHIFIAMPDLSFTAKMKIICRLTLSNTSIFIKKQRDLLADPLEIVIGLRQGYPISYVLISCVKSILRKVRVHRNGTICTKYVQLLAYVDDIAIVGHTKQEVTAGFSGIECETTDVGLAVN